jgi:predicted amidohydrolase YtcJ
VRVDAGPRYDDCDCNGDLLLPAFVDAHIHLLAFAAALAAVDCSPARVRSIPELTAAIARRAVQTPRGQWIRAVGYRETELLEGRHPTRWELDAAAPLHPVRLIHASGHGCVLNSRALAQVGIGIATEESGAGVIGRRLSDGEPDGLVLGMNARLEDRLPPATYEDLRVRVALANRRLLQAGITAVHDMGANNDGPMLAILQRLQSDGALTVDVQAAVGYRHFVPGSWTGLVKLTIEEAGDEREPPLPVLAEQIRAVHLAGARAAVHCISAGAVSEAVEAFESALRGLPGSGRRHRLEHAAVCPTDLRVRIARLGLTVVSNPGFLLASGDRYLREVPPYELPQLYDAAGLRTAGVPVCAGSDAPFGPVDPPGSVRVLMRRRSAAGHALPGATVGLEPALAMHTCVAAWAGFQETERGMLRAGLVADMVRLPRTGADWTSVEGSGHVKTMRAGAWIGDGT